MLQTRTKKTDNNLCGEPFTAVAASSSVTELLATSATKEDDAKIARLVVASLASVVPVTFAHHLPALACFLLYLAGTKFKIVHELTRSRTGHSRAIVPMTPGLPTVTPSLSTVQRIVEYGCVGE